MKNNIRLARTLRRMPQYALAKETGIKQPRISLIENDFAVPRRDELERMAKVLGVLDPQELWSPIP